MIQRYEAFMDGVALSSIDNSIVITDIGYRPANMQYKTNRVANRGGAKVSSSYYESSSVSVTFMIREYSTVKRQQICNKIIQWANGSYFSTNDRKWQRLRCVCEAFPAIESAKNWLDELTVSFKALNPPYWQEDNPAIVTLGGTGGATSGSGSAFIPGNVKETLLSVSITAKATLSSLTVTVGNTSISLTFPTNDKPASGDVINIDYDDNMMLRIKKGTTSYLACRLAASADDLICESGKTNTFSYTSSGKSIVTFTVRGWWY